MMLKVFSKAIDAGEIAQSVNSRTAVIGLFSLVDGLIYNWLLAPDFFPLVEYGNTAMTLVMIATLIPLRFVLSLAGN